MSTQAAAALGGAAEAAQPHTPPEQTWPAGQALPQAPQLAGSVAVDDAGGAAEGGAAETAQAATRARRSAADAAAATTPQEGHCQQHGRQRTVEEAQGQPTTFSLRVILHLIAPDENRPFIRTSDPRRRCPTSATFRTARAVARGRARRPTKGGRRAGLHMSCNVQGRLVQRRASKSSSTILVRTAEIKLWNRARQQAWSLVSSAGGRALPRLESWPLVSSVGLPRLERRGSVEGLGDPQENDRGDPRENDHPGPRKCDRGARGKLTVGAAGD